MVRAAAMAAWFKLAERDKDAIALAALHDRARGVQKFAVQLVRKHGAYIPFSTVRDLLARSDDPALLLRLVEGKKWDWLESVLSLSIRLGAEEARRLGYDDALGDWLRGNAWYEHPGQQQLQFLLSAPATATLRALLATQPQRLAGVLRQLQQHVS